MKKFSIEDGTMQSVCIGMGTDASNIDFAMLSKRKREKLLELNNDTDNLNLIYSLCDTIKELNNMFCDVVSVIEKHQKKQPYSIVGTKLIGDLCDALDKHLHKD